MAGKWWLLLLVGFLSFLLKSMTSFATQNKTFDDN